MYSCATWLSAKCAAKKEYSEKLIKANDKIAEVVAENTVLKERNDVLYKLGKIYIDKQKEKGQDEVEDIQIVQEVESNSQNHLQNGWKTLRKRGFKKVSGESRNQETQSSHSIPINAALNQEDQPTSRNQEQERRVERIRFCHYYVNGGSCRFGDNCKFKHQAAPPCRSGDSCRREKCMYSHPRSSQTSQSFLLNQNLGQTSPWQVPMTWALPFQGNLQNVSPWMENSQQAYQRK